MVDSRKGIFLVCQKRQKKIFLVRERMKSKKKRISISQ